MGTEISRLEINQKIIMKIIVRIFEGILIGLLIGALFYVNSSESVKKKTGDVAGVGNFIQFTTATNYWIGPGIATKVATSSPNRSYLEISNLSGATSTAQGVYCTTGGNLDNNGNFNYYQGFFIAPSSTKSFNRNNGVPSGTVYCKNPIASSTVSVVDN